MEGSPTFRANGKPYSIGPVVDVVGFHLYEGLASAFSSSGSRTIEQVLDDVSAVFEKWEQQPLGFTYARMREYWHTEGNFDFIINPLSVERRASWRIQFFTRAFAAGVRKVCVMDATEQEQSAVRAYVHALPWPFPMQLNNQDVRVLRGQVNSFQHLDDTTVEGGQVWVVWAVANTGDAIVEVPVRRGRVEVIAADGRIEMLSAIGGRVRLDLMGDSMMPAPIIVVDRLVRAEN